LSPGDWNRFAAENQLLFVFKYHPKTLTEHEWDISSCENIIEYDKFSDVYPLLGQTDVLITDYSSIFTDFILLNRPVVFFPFDYQRYVNEERALQFDYHQVTPGRKCMTQDEVFDELRRIVVHESDDYGPIRNEKIRHFYDTADGLSCERLWKAITAIW
jgi:CDP-glycerol glycerophosphotransferase